MGHKTYRWERRELKRLYAANAECDFCGEPVQSSQEFEGSSLPEFRHALVGRDLKCAMCCQTDWEDYCHAVGANPHTGILHID